MIKLRNYHVLISLLFVAFIFLQCKQDDVSKPEIRLIFDEGFTLDGDTLEIGRPIRFRVEVVGEGANITNFTVKKHFGNEVKTVLDSGLNSIGFVKDFVFYQGIEDRVEWRLSVMDRNRNEESVAINLYKDANSTFGGIAVYQAIRLGYQSSLLHGHFFLPGLGQVFFEDTASMHQDLTDILVYFNHSEDQGVLKPSPTFSSPGEESSGTGMLYNEYYPFLKGWTIRNYTKWDIRAVNGITAEAYHNAHHDSLLIVSYDDVWGKKKYKWAMPGLFIPFQTSAGKRGIIHVIEADTVPNGSIRFSMKIQL
jgi:hypothetical protein